MFFVKFFLLFFDQNKVDISAILTLPISQIVNKLIWDHSKNLMFTYLPLPPWVFLAPSLTKV